MPRRSPIPAPGPEPLVEPLVRSATYRHPTSAGLAEAFANRSPLVYTRFGNPTIQAVARRIARLEGAEEALLFASGMAAITTSLLTFLRAGRHVVAQNRIFAQTRTFLHRLASLGVRTTFVDSTSAADFAAALEPETDLVYVETPSNPLLDVVDIAAVAAIARERDALLLVDSTFATPVLQQPLALGADLVLHSATKFLNGHSDVSCGAVAGSGRLLAEVYESQRLLGGIAQPDTAWLLGRGLPTLDLRIRAQAATAARLAAALEGLGGIRRVLYPLLPSHPGFEVARRQMTAGGAMVAFEVEKPLEAAAVLDRLRVIRIATSLGGVESVAEIPAELDFARRELGGGTDDGFDPRDTPPGLVRLSVGLEPFADLLGDVETALRSAARPATRSR